MASSPTCVGGCAGIAVYVDLCSLHLMSAINVSHALRCRAGSMDSVLGPPVEGPLGEPTGWVAVFRAKYSRLFRSWCLQTGHLSDSESEPSANISTARMRFLVFPVWCVVSCR